MMRSASCPSTSNHMAGELDKTERMKTSSPPRSPTSCSTPLTSIKGWVETIAAIRDPADPNFRRGVQVISSEADRLYSMVEELLDFSRMQNGLKLDLQLLDLVAEVSDAAIMVERRVELEGLHLAYDEPEEPMPVMADPAGCARCSSTFWTTPSNILRPTALYAWTCCPTATALSSISRMKGGALRRTIWKTSR